MNFRMVLSVCFLAVKVTLPWSMFFDAVVADGDAMGVATEIVEHLVGVAEGAFGVDVPALSLSGAPNTSG